MWLRRVRSTPGEPPRSERSWRLSLGLIVLAQAMALLTLSFQQAFIPFYLAEDLGVTDPNALAVWVGVSSAATPLMVMLLTPVWGVLADRFGQKPMVLRALAGAGLVFLVLSVVQSPWQLVVMRLLLGVFSGVNAATIGLLALIVPQERLGSSLGWAQTGRFAGLTLGPALGGLAADLLGYRGAFAFAAVVALVLCVAAFAILPNPPPAARNAPRRSLLSGFRYVGGEPALLIPIGLVFLSQLGHNIVVPYLPVLLAQISDARENLAALSGLILSTGSLAAAVAGILMGRLGERFGYGPLLIIGALAAAAFQVAHTLAQTPEQLLALRFGFGLCFGGLQPLAQALAGMATPRERSGMVFGVISSAQSGGNLIGPLLGSVLAVSFGFSGPFFLAAAVLIGCGVVASRAGRVSARAENT